MGEIYYFLKLIHIVSAAVLFGTGIGIAYFMWMASRNNKPLVIYNTARYVVIADWCFTTPAIVVQFVSGILLMKVLNYSFTSPWFYTVIGLFIFIGACWIPVVHIQYKIRNLAYKDIDKDNMPDSFRQLMHYWTILGCLAFAAILVLYYLMVIKPIVPY